LFTGQGLGQVNPTAVPTGAAAVLLLVVMWWRRRVTTTGEREGVGAAP
jgi:hypothetical protein